MKIKTRTFELSIKKKETMSLRALPQSVIEWCEGCGHRSQMLKPELAAQVAGITPRDIYRLIEADKIHFTEAGNGWLLVCLDSIGERNGK
jgi:hypothetical protein